MSKEQNPNDPAVKRAIALSGLRNKAVNPDLEDDDTEEDINALTEESVLEDLYTDAFEEDNDLTEDDLDDTDKSSIIEPVVQKHKIKVNGVEREVSYEELVRKAQLVESAEEYQKQAKQAYDIAQNKLSQLSQQQDVDLQHDDEAELAEIATALQMGDTEEAVNALKKLRNKTPSLSRDEIASEVEKKLQFQAAVSKFQEEYSDIFSDPVLTQIVVAEDQKLVAQNDPRDYMDRYRDIGNSVREWRDKLTGKSNEPEKLTIADKQARKEKAPSYPSRKASSASNTNSDEDYDGEPSREEKMRSLSLKAKARGQVFTPPYRY